MIRTKDAFIDAKEVSEILGIGMAKSYAVIKVYNAELAAQNYFTMRGKCTRKYFEQKIYGYEDCYSKLNNPAWKADRVAEESSYQAEEKSPDQSGQD